MTSSSSAAAFSYVGRLKAEPGSFINKAFITDSRIKQLPDPVDDQDPVTLHYLTQLGIQNMLFIQEMSLQGTAWADVSETVVPWYGNFNLIVNGKLEAFPNAQWQIARASFSDYGNITQGVFAPTNSDCVLQLRWQPNTLLQIRKTTNDFDGEYQIKVT